MNNNNNFRCRVFKLVKNKTCTVGYCQQRAEDGIKNNHITLIISTLQNRMQKTIYHEKSIFNKKQDTPLRDFIFDFMYLLQL